MNNVDLKYYQVNVVAGLVFFIARDARSAKRGIAIISRPSVRPSVCNVDVPWAQRLD